MDAMIIVELYSYTKNPKSSANQPEPYILKNKNYFIVKKKLKIEIKF